MAAISGKEGTITFGSGYVCVKDWSVDITTDRLDSTTTCSGGWRQFVEGLEGYTGSATTFEHIDVSDDFVEVSFDNDKVTVSGSALINEAISAPVDGLNEFTYDIQFTGEVVIVAKA
jgi:hypothetical protein